MIFVIISILVLLYAILYRLDVDAKEVKRKNNKF